MDAVFIFITKISLLQLLRRPANMHSVLSMFSLDPACLENYFMVFKISFRDSLIS